MKLNRLAPIGFFITILIITCSACKTSRESRSAEAGRYLKAVRGYADRMISEGRDTYGSVHSPLFAAALNRSTMKPGPGESFGSIEGVRESDRSLSGANPLCDIGLYKILYKLSSVTGDARYGKEADNALIYFFKNCQSPNTGLMAWGEHLFWDFHTDSAGGRGEHEMSPWPLWDRCYELAPEACHAFALGLWHHQVADHVTGDFSRHAGWVRHDPHTGFEFPRYAGQMIEVWADAFNRQPDTTFIHAARVILNRMKQNRDPVTGIIHAGTHPSHFPGSWPSSELELARCLWKTADAFPGEMRDEMVSFAREIDRRYLSYPNDPGNKGFVTALEAATGNPGWTNGPLYSSRFGTGYGMPNHAGLCQNVFARYLQLSKADLPDADKFLQLIMLTADDYLTAMPDTTQLLKPDSFASIIELLLNAHEVTGDEKYLNRAVVFADEGMELFLDDISPLPKATNKHHHYETITGGADFENALLDLSIVCSAGI